MYGAISKKEVLNFLKDNEVKIHSDDIVLNEQIRSIGEHEIIVNPDFLIPKAFKISMPTLTSFIGSSDKDTLIVSPIPSLRRLPIPMDDFTVPVIRLPASVIPKCKG